MTARPTLLFYCQHSLGIGHLTRSFALVQALKPRFEVVFLNGGRLPPGLEAPAGITRIDLPPLGMDDGHTVVSREAGRSVAEVRAERRALILDAVAQHRPALLLVELFPFGRKKFAVEILPMIRAARRLNPGLRVACSLRDILVDVRPDQQHHDDRARWLTDRYFDAVLVHADPALARLEESFRPARPMRTPVVHTGYVVPDRAAGGAGAALRPDAPLLVSAGGGIVGERLFRAVLAGWRRLAAPPPLRIVAGPFLPETAWLALQAEAAAADPARLSLVRQVPDLVAELRQARASISQCGYNSTLDLLVAGLPALVVPYRTPTENEQSERACRLAERGAVLHLDDAAADDPAQMAAAIDALLRFAPQPQAIALDGAARSASALAALLTDPTLGALPTEPMLAALPTEPVLPPARAEAPPPAPPPASPPARAPAAVPHPPCPVIAALEAMSAGAGPREARLWLRDDDAGWADAELQALVELTESAGQPIDLAVIPQALSPGLARWLRGLPETVGLHQHGQAHQSHEPEGSAWRKCEFGPARSIAQQQADLLDGRERLLQHLDGRLDPIFTPPWNRIGPDTPALLAALGYAALSRDHRATTQFALAEVPVHTDFSRCWREGGGDAVAADLAAHLQRWGSAGLMLHHAVMDEAQRRWLADALRRWRAHPLLRGVRMLQCIGAFGQAQRPGALAAAAQTAQAAMGSGACP